MKRTTEQRLHDALAAARLVDDAVTGRTFDDYLGDVWLRSGIEHQLEIIGEALNSVRRMSADVGDELPRIHEWIALRHIIAHVYDEIDHHIIWDTCVRDIPELKSQLEALLREASTDNDPGTCSRSRKD